MTISIITMLIRTKLAFASQSAYCSQVRKQILTFSSSVYNIESHEKASELYKVDIGIRQSKEQNKSQRGRHVNQSRTKDGREFAHSEARKRMLVRTLDKVTARAVAEKVQAIFDQDRVILEFDAGPGILSEALLKVGMEKVMALEQGIQFHENLQKIKEMYRERFNFFRLSVYKVMSLPDEKLPKELQSTVIYKKGHYVQIIGQVYSWGLLVDIARQIRTFQGFLSAKCVNLCLILPEPSWEHFLDCKGPNMYLVDRILFTLCFDHKILLRLRGKEFDLFVKDKGEVKHVHDLVLLHAKSKPTTEFDISEMEVFLKQFHNHTVRHRLVIPSLERWSPSCGEELIRRGLPVFARFSDLTPNQLLEVFLYFRTLPNVKDSGLFD